MGAPAKSGRIAFGTLMIKERLRVTDEETVEQIAETPYLQYFWGLCEYRQEWLLDPSMMVHFRSRFGEVLCWLKIQCAECLITLVTPSNKRPLSSALPRLVRILLQHNLKESPLAA